MRLGLRCTAVLCCFRGSFLVAAACVLSQQGEGPGHVCTCCDVCSTTWCESAWCVLTTCCVCIPTRAGVLFPVCTVPVLCVQVCGGSCSGKCVVRKWFAGFGCWPQSGVCWRLPPWQQPHHARTALFLALPDAKPSRLDRVVTGVCRAYSTWDMCQGLLLLH
jgi:hypothetical protein